MDTLIIQINHLELFLDLFRQITRPKSYTLSQEKSTDEFTVKSYK